MKTNALIRIIFFGLVIIVLLGILMIGLSMNLYTVQRTVHYTEVQSTMYTESADSRSENTYHSQSFSASSIQSMEIDWVGGDIIIEPIDGNEILITETMLSFCKPFVASQHGSTLKILFCEDSSGTNPNNRMEKGLHIVVPRDWYCSELKMDSASSYVTLNNLTCGRVNIKSVSGNCEITDCQIGSMNTESVSGNLCFQSSVEELAWEGVSGTADIAVTNTPRSIKAESVSGNVVLTLPKDCGFKIKQENLAGILASEFDTSEENGHIIYGDGSCQIDASGVFSRFTIRKAE